MKTQIHPDIGEAGTERVRERVREGGGQSPADEVRNDGAPLSHL